MKWRSVRGVPGDQVVREVAVNVGRNLILLAVGFLLVLFGGQLVGTVGTLGSWMFLAVVGFLAVRFFFGCLVGLADSVLEGAGGGEMEGSGWIVFVTAARVLELVVAAGMTYFLFHHFE